MKRLRLGELVELPRWDDARWLITAALASYDLFAVRWPLFNRRPSQWLAAIGACLAVELIGAVALRRPLRWLSGLISALGVFLLCDTGAVWPYAALGVLSIASKFLIREERSHIFNPTNFAIVLGVLWFPSTIIIDASRWSAPLRGALLMAAVGLLISWRAKRLGVALAYQGVFGLTALARALSYGVHPIMPLAPMTGPGFQLFSFYMVTDPATSPAALREGLIFGALVAVLDGLFRHLELLNAPFHALFVMTALNACWQARRRRAAPWLSAARLGTASASSNYGASGSSAS
jgi:enediyne biosynthesis protein E5